MSPSSRSWIAAAVSKSPASAAWAMALVSAGQTLDTTDTMPCPPRDITGTARESSPAHTGRSGPQAARILPTFLRSGLASLTPAILGTRLSFR